MKIIKKMAFKSKLEKQSMQYLKSKTKITELSTK
jgi:hypothetical protein